MSTLNYTTKIAASKTCGEMQAALAQSGAAKVAVEYTDGRACGLLFSLQTPHGERVFDLPVDIHAMQRNLMREEKAGRLRSGAKAERTSLEQAERVAWRVCKDWLLAQLALIESQMATLDQVMLPYLRVNGEQTLYAAYREREEVALLESTYAEIES